MITRAQKVRLGVFMVLSSALFIGTLLTLAGVQLGKQRDIYYVKFKESLSGLDVGAPVKFSGVTVGRVEAMKIDPQDVGAILVTISLEKGTPLKKDAKIVVESSGITGIKYVDIQGGTNESERVEPNSVIEGAQSFFDRLTGRADAIGKKAEEVLESLKDTLSQENRAKLLALLDDVDALAQETRATISENRENIRKTIENLARVSESLGKTVKSVGEEAEASIRSIRELASDLKSAMSKERLERIASNIEKITSALRKTTDSGDVEQSVKLARETLEQAKKLLADIDVTVLRARENLQAGLAYLRDATEHLSEFAREVRENPSLLLRGKKETER